jgi:hypothetical protein
MAVIYNGKRYSLHKYATEKEFEEEIVLSSKLLFGKNTIYINAKKKIESKSLGGVVPDGFFFDFSDINDPQFYIVEVELCTHSFFNHIFPQITKFFAFFKNNKLQKSLIDKLFSTINTDDGLKGEFKKYLVGQEVYKFLSDIIESSQNILLVTDGSINELPEIMDTYTDTWGKMVRQIEVKKHAIGNDTIFTVDPDFETIQYIEPAGEQLEIEEEEVKASFSEEYHLDGVGANVKEIYSRIKDICKQIIPGVVFNPQKYYVSIKTKKNVAFLKLRIRKLRFIALLPEDVIRSIIKDHHIASLSQAVQDFYNGPCAAIDITDLQHVKEIEELIQKLIAYHENA